MSLFGGTGDGGAAATEAARQANITAGEGQVDQQFAGFDPAFYSKYGKTVTAAQMPQLMDQYQTTGKNLTYALARGGNMTGSAAQQETASLGKQLNAGESQVANNAQNAENTLQSNVQTQKGQLYQQLEQGGTPSAISAQAQAAASQMRAPSPIQPLGNLFSDWSNEYLANKTAQAFQNNAGGGSAWFGLLNSNYGAS